RPEEARTLLVSLARAYYAGRRVSGAPARLGSSRGSGAANSAGDGALARQRRLPIWAAPASAAIGTRIPGRRRLPPVRLRVPPGGAILVARAASRPVVDRGARGVWPHAADRSSVAGSRGEHREIPGRRRSLARRCGTGGGVIVVVPARRADCGVRARGPR